MRNLLLSLIVLGFLTPGCLKKRKVLDYYYDGVSYVKFNIPQLHDTFEIEANYTCRFPMKGCNKKRIKISTAGDYYIQYQMTRPEYVLFNVNTKEAFGSYLIPNDTLVVSLDQLLDDNNNIIIRYVSESEIFKYCNSKRSKFGYFRPTENCEFARKYLFKLGRSKNDFYDADAALKAEEIKNMVFLDEYSNQLPEWFVTMEKANIQYNAAYARQTIVNDTSSYYSTYKPPVTIPIYNPSAKLSSEYYDYLTQFFLTGYPSKHNFSGIDRLVRIFQIEYPKIDSILKGDIKNHFIVGLLASYYVICQNDEEVRMIDSLFKSYDFNLTSAENKYLNDERTKLNNMRIAFSNYKMNSVPLDFELKDLNNDAIKLSDFRGKHIYLHFWATWCAPCISEIPLLNKLTEELNTNGVELVNVCLDGDNEKWKRIVKDKRLLGTNLICDKNWDEVITNLFKISTIPHYALIDDKGLIIENHCGGPKDINGKISLKLNTE